MRTAICPVCLHWRTMQARRDGDTPCLDDMAEMKWLGLNHGGGGHWKCRMCGVALTPCEAGVLLDAALMHAAPDCDSIGEEGLHFDTVQAFNGGRAR